MSEFYGPSQRALQDEFDTRRLADAHEMTIVAEGIDDDRKAFIESRDFFFLSTVGADGWPTVSYKGGPTGVVQVEDEQTIVFPSYDGNGMFLSMGNIAAGTRRRGEDRAAVHRLRDTQPAAAPRDCHRPSRRSGDRALPGCGADRAGYGRQHVRQLCALHPSARAGAVVRLRARRATVSSRSRRGSGST